MPTFGIHAVYENDFQTAILSAAKHGFHYVQFDLNVPAFYIDELPRARIHEIKSMADDLGIRLSLHAPGDNVGLFTDYPLIRHGLIDHIKRVLEQANLLNVHHLTIHPLSPPSFRRADTLEDGFGPKYHEYFKNILEENLVELTGASGSVRIIVENCHLGRTAAEALTEIITEGAGIFLALDWAKMHRKDSSIDPGQQEFFSQHKAHIIELHLHDMDRQGRSHLAPGQGGLDFTSLFKNFYNPDQWLTVEVRPLDEAVKAKLLFQTIMKKGRKT